MRLKNLEHLTLFKAKELAKTILKSETLKSESIAELITLIYGEKVKPEELQQTDRLSLQTNPLKKNLAHKKSKNLARTARSPTSDPIGQCGMNSRTKTRRTSDLC